MKRGDRVRTHLDERGTITRESSFPYEWLVFIDNAGFEEPYRETELRRIDEETGTANPEVHPGTTPDQ